MKYQKFEQTQPRIQAVNTLKMLSEHITYKENKLVII